MRKLLILVVLAAALVVPTAASADKPVAPTASFDAIVVNWPVAGEVGIGIESSAYFTNGVYVLISFSCDNGYTAAVFSNEQSVFPTGAPTTCTATLSTVYHHKTLILDSATFTVPLVN